METLTEKQQSTLDFIRAYIREHGLAPTIQEIATGMGWKSPNAAQSHVNALVRKGMLKIKRGANRGMSSRPPPPIMTAWRWKQRHELCRPCERRRWMQKAGRMCD